jgi:hypothetical protein
MSMARYDKTNEIFAEAVNLAKSGRFRNVAEVEAALRRKGLRLRPEMSQKVMRCWIDGICFRVRKAKRWDI